LQTLACDACKHGSSCARITVQNIGPHRKAFKIAAMYGSRSARNVG